MTSQRPPEPPEDHPTTSAWELLDRVSGSALDEDYEKAAARRGDSGTGRRPPRLLGASVLVAFGLLVAVTALESQSAEPVERQERAALISQINDRESEIKQLARESDQLRHEIDTLQGTAKQIGTRGEELLASLSEARIVAGAVPVTGPGIRIVVDDSDNASSTGGTVLDVDLQILVNGLWQAGAEAVAINGNRLGSVSAIRTANKAITVNYNSLTRPYTVTAIGSPNTLQADFAETPSGRAWFDLETNYGIRFEMESVDELTLPPLPANLLRASHAERQGELP